MAAKAVLVTGTSSGIGYSIAAELPKHGYHVIAAMRDHLRARTSPASMSRRKVSAIY